MKKAIYKLDNNEALDFFLQHENYCTLELPEYFDFKKILEEINKSIDNNLISISPNKKDLMGKNINHQVLVSKDGLYSWRKITLINPFYYVYFAKKITSEENWKKIQEKFRSFSSNKKFTCSSIPLKTNNENSTVATSVQNWWENFEQKSLAFSLNYEYMFSTDISNFYPSIYTHSFEWVFVEKSIAKQKSNNNNPGRIIDEHIQMMMDNQTNGIPLGSVLMDMFAELILGEIDLRLKNNLKEKGIIDYDVLRYRDDYRIFSNSKDDLDIIIKELVFVLAEFGLDLNSKKTYLHDDIITHAIKDEKYDFMKEPVSNLSFQKRIYMIYRFSIKHPNSKTTVRYLNEVLIELEKKKRMTNKGDAIEAMLGIMASLISKNPTTIPVGLAIFVQLLRLKYKKEESPKISRIEALYQKLIKQPNTEFLDIWVQRIQSKITSPTDIQYRSPLCDRVNDEIKRVKSFMYDRLWDISWIEGIEKSAKKRKVISIISKTNILDQDKFALMDSLIPYEEVSLFVNKKSQ